jgi:hypothetical protein
MMNNMKKFLLSFTVMMMGSALLTGCLKDDDNDNKATQTYLATQGALIINNGNAYNGIDGSLTFLDVMSEPLTVQQNVFKNVNGVSLGGTPNDVMVYGDKIYITGSDENAVFVLDKKTFRQLRKISTVQEMGEAEGVTPRALESYGDKVYVSTYGGCVGVIDTVSLNIQKIYKVGSAPEGMAVGGSSDSDMSLYVANSDYGNGNGSISKISLASGTVTEIKNENIHNPQKLAIAGDVVFVLDWGYYDENWLQQEAGVYKINGSTVTKVIPDATDMTAAGFYIYTYNYPYGSTTPGYSLYNINTNSLGSLYLSNTKPIESPCAISIDPNSGCLYIASRQMDPDTGYPSYTLPGYVNVYNGSGQLLGKYATGVEPHSIHFMYGMETVQF